MPKAKKDEPMSEDTPLEEVKEDDKIEVCDCGGNHSLVAGQVQEYLAVNEERTVKRRAEKGNVACMRKVADLP